MNRSKCYYMMDEKNLAFQDLQKYISLKPQDPDIHECAGNLLFNIKAYEDAIKTYSHCTNISKNEKLLKLRINCNLVMKELNNALTDMQTFVDLTQDEKMIFDKEALTALKVSA